MQLKILGKQTKYIVGSPEMTHFKCVYLRHTNFSIESIPCVFNNRISNNSETEVTSIIHKSGDLVLNAHIEFTLKRTEPSTPPTGGSYINWTNNTGHALIKKTTLQIENQIIDTLYSEWLDIWNELVDINKKEYLMLNKHNAKHIYLKSNNYSSNSVKCYVNLPFYFHNNPGLALPLIAIQNNKVLLKTTFRNPYTLINTDYTSGSIGTISYEQTPILYVDYIFLDVKERKVMATKQHQYLIEQVQFNNKMNLTNNIELNFNNPIKELIWICRNKNAGKEYNTQTISNNADAYSNNTVSINKNNDYFNYMSIGNNYNEKLYTQNSYDGFDEVELILNGTSRFNKRKASYFRTIQPYNHHSKKANKYIYVYSFSLNPEKHQPSGVCNFSKIKTSTLKLTNTVENSEILIFAKSYNLLRIMKGQAGLSYTN